VISLSALANLLPEKALVFIQLESGWVLELVWMFWRRDNSVAAATI
jgi:hypothetical protein